MSDGPVQVGPGPHWWDWDDPSLRAELVVGTILETYDCAYIKVKKITPEGIIQDGGILEGHLWTWPALKGLECLIVEQPPKETMTEPVTLGNPFDRAFALASKLHRDQKRKGSEVPYISHLMGVAALVLEDGGDEEEAIAGLLHDALEDCAEHISGEDLEEQFGLRVRELVEACTDTPADFEGGRKPDWKARKDAYIAHIASGEMPLRVSLADKVHNVRCLLRDHRLEGEAVWDRFSATKGETLWYYRALAVAYREGKAEGFLVEELERIVDEIEARVSQGSHP